MIAEEFVSSTHWMQNQSITTAPRVKLEEEYDHQFVGPDRNERNHKQRPPMKRDDSHNGKKEKDKSGKERKENRRQQAPVSSLGPTWKDLT